MFIDDIWKWKVGFNSRLLTKSMTRMPIELQKVIITQRELFEKHQEPGIIRVGATNNPERRKNEYRRKRFIGTMYFAYTRNMKRLENRLLDDCNDCRHNHQRKSNAKEKEGFVYVIQGQRMDV